VVILAEVGSFRRIKESGTKGQIVGKPLKKIENLNEKSTPKDRKDDKYHDYHISQGLCNEEVIFVGGFLKILRT
jgi:hypothetical protein